MYLINHNRNKAILGIIMEITSGLNDKGDLLLDRIINT
jgi:hypothetical protein